MPFRAQSKNADKIHFQQSDSDISVQLRLELLLVHSLPAHSGMLAASHRYNCRPVRGFQIGGLLGDSRGKAVEISKSCKIV